KFAATAVYGEQVPAFLRLFDLCSGNYPRFYASVRRIGALPAPSRAEALKAATTCD
ncbi:aminopeptidase, partial [Mesorhizobium sp. M2A.F.Ca.ET.046.02.1.1]